MRIHTLVLAAAAVFAIQCVCAQQSNEKETTLQFLAFPPQNPPVPVELLIRPKEAIPIEIPGNELSPAYKVKNLTAIVVGLTTENAQKQAHFQVLGTATPLASDKQIVLLLRKGPENKDGFVVVPVDGDLAKFSGGNFFFINASNLPIGGKIGDKIFALKPGQKNLVKPAPSHEGGGCQVTLSFQREEKWKTFYDTRWSVNKRYRTLVFFYQDPETESLGVAPIVEML